MRPLNLLISAHQGIWWWGYIDDKSNHQPTFIKWPAMPGLVLSTWHDYHSVLKAAERAITITHSLQMRLHEVNLPKVPQSLTRRSEKQTLSLRTPSIIPLSSRSPIPSQCQLSARRAHKPRNTACLPSSLLSPGNRGKFGRTCFLQNASPG